MKFTKTKTKGFTLIEIMVATSIFMVIMLIALGALISSSDTAKKSQALRSAMDNVNFAMESMTRSLRMGSDYTCVISGDSISIPAAANADCALGGGAIVFTPADHAAGSRNAAYTLNPRGDGTFVLRRCTPNPITNAIECIDMVSRDVDVQTLKFFVNGVNGTDPFDKIQPSVYIIIKGTVTVKGVPNTFAIQTMASQRSSE